MDVTKKDSRYLRGLREALQWVITGNGNKLHRSIKEITELMDKAGDAENTALVREYNERLDREEVRPKWLVTTVNLRTNAVECVAVNNIDPASLRLITAGTFKTVIRMEKI